ncbi:MAG: histidine kinase [Saprospiraceae bacterium]|nr:histidine kinase [Saprospiraceae bacterium]
MERHIKRDIIFWLVYSVYLLLLIFPNLMLPEGVQLSVSEKLLRAVLVIVMVFPAKLMAVYAALPALIRKIVYGEGKWVWVMSKWVISILFGLALYRLALYFYIYPEIYQVRPDHQTFFVFGRFLSNFADLTVPMLFFGVIWMYDARSKADQEKKVIELQFLKNQSSPHFLFNALNSIYGLVRKNDPEAGPALMKLSGILRYLLYETTDHKIPLQKELEMVHQFLEIQKLRFGNTLELVVHPVEDVKNNMIASGLLLPLLENAFKFGFSDVLNRIFVEISIEMKDDSCFLFVVKNHVSGSNFSETGGLGLVNLKRRLELEYPDAFTFETIKENKMYVVRLQINLGTWKF